MEWISLVSVVVINLLLSSDNALAIAMASRKLPVLYRQKAIVWGSVCAVGLQILFTYLASILLSIPYVRIGGGVLLTWIAYHLAVAEDGEGDDDGRERQCDSQFAAIRLIVAANIVMCLDNVLAVAAVAADNPLILCAGLIISCPVIMGGSTVVAALLEKFPLLIWLGAVFLGWTAGGIITSEAALRELLQHANIAAPYIQVIFAIIVSYGIWRKAGEKITLSDKSAKS